MTTPNQNLRRQFLHQQLVGRSDIEMVKVGTMDPRQVEEDCIYAPLPEYGVALFVRLSTKRNWVVQRRYIGTIGKPFMPSPTSWQTIERFKDKEKADAYLNRESYDCTRWNYRIRDEEIE